MGDHDKLAKTITCALKQSGLAPPANRTFYCKIINSFNAKFLRYI